MKKVLEKSWKEPVWNKHPVTVKESPKYSDKPIENRSQNLYFKYEPNTSNSGPEQ
jgi:hypothetical protein